MSTLVAELREAHDRQLRGRIPRFPPAGAVVERDGPVVRTHYGTHGTVDHQLLAGTADLDELIGRQQAAFAARAEPVTWTVFDHDGTPQLADRLRAAGFTAGWRRPLLVGDIGEVPAPRPDPGHRVRPMGRSQRSAWSLIREMAAASGPHRTRLAELEADGRPRHWAMQVIVVEHDGRIRAAGWADRVHDTHFVSLGGMTAPDPHLLAGLAAWAGRSDVGYPESPLRPARHLVAEADEGGDLHALLLRAGCHPITWVTSYRWRPSGTPAAERPVRRLFDDPEHDAVWDACTARFEFQPSIRTFPGITEPESSVTWWLGAIPDRADPIAGELQAIIERGLRRCARPGEPLYWLDWQHQGARFDPARVGGSGQPRWPGIAYPDGDYYLYLTADMRLGTFGHPWEDSLCVFGDELLTVVEKDLTALLGTVMRRAGRNIGTTWSFGPGTP